MGYGASLEPSDLWFHEDVSWRQTCQSMRSAVVGCGAIVAPLSHTPLRPAHVRQQLHSCILRLIRRPTSILYRVTSLMLCVVVQQTYTGGVGDVPLMSVENSRAERQAIVA